VSTPNKSGEKKTMIEDFHDLYSGSIDKRLFPYHLQLEEAVGLMVDADERHKHLCMDNVKDAFTELSTAKMMIKKPGDKRDK
jgi:hypothetical protein